MKKILSLPLLLLLVLFSGAQTFDVAFGDEVKGRTAQQQLVPDGNGFLGMEVAPNRFPLVHSTHKKRLVRFGITLSKWTSSMILKKESTLFNGERSCGPFPPELLLLYGQPFLLYGQFLSDDEDSKWQVMLAKVDTATLQPGQPKELFLLEQRNLGLTRSVEALNKLPLGIKASPDSSKILLIWATQADNYILFDVLDRHLDRLWSKEQEIRSDGVSAIQSACVNNRGSVFFTYFPATGGTRGPTLATTPVRTPSGMPVRTSDRTPAGKEGLHEPQISLCNPDGTWADRELRLANGHPISLSLLNDKDSNYITVTGTWSDKPGYVSGVYEARIDLTKEKINQIRQVAFPDTLIKRLHQDHWAQTNAKKYGLEPIDLQAFLLDDGSIGLVGEFRAWDQIDPRKDTVFVDGDFLYVHLPIDPAGTAVFRVLTDYRRDEEKSIGARFFALPRNNGITLLYPYNWAHTQTGIAFESIAFSNYYNVDLMAAAFSDSGEARTETLVSYGRDHYVTALESIQILSTSSFLVLLQKIQNPGKLDDSFEWCRITIH
jgi:hypothetical protein